MKEGMGSNVISKICVSFSMSIFPDSTVHRFFYIYDYSVDIIMDFHRKLLFSFQIENKHSMLYCILFELPLLFC